MCGCRGCHQEYGSLRASAPRSAWCHSKRSITLLGPAPSKYLPYAGVGEQLGSPLSRLPKEWRLVEVRLGRWGWLCVRM
jgi:hypothetical protein